MTQWGLDNLFNPGKRHMDDEKRRLQSTREEVGDSSGGRRIDLDGGKVLIALPTPDDPNALQKAESDPATASESRDSDVGARVPRETDEEGRGRDDVSPRAMRAHSSTDPEAEAADEHPATTRTAGKPLGDTASAWSRRG